MQKAVLCAVYVRVTQQQYLLLVPVSMDTPGTENFVYTVRRVQKHLLPHFTVGVGFKTAYYAQ